MGDVRVRVSVEHMRDDLTEYLRADAADKATLIAQAVASALDEYDIQAAVRRIANQELEKFVREAAAVYFKRLLTSPEAHAAVLAQIQQTINGGTT